jgi:hypothetical protein
MPMRARKLGAAGSRLRPGESPNWRSEFVTREHTEWIAAFWSIVEMEQPSDALQTKISQAYYERTQRQISETTPRQVRYGQRRGRS